MHHSNHQIQQQKTQSDQSGLKLSDYQLGERLGQPSSEAAVYAATHKTEQVRLLYVYGKFNPFTAKFKKYCTLSQPF